MHASRNGRRRPAGSRSARIGRGSCAEAILAEVECVLEAVRVVVGVRHDHLDPRQPPRHRPAVVLERVQHRALARAGQSCTSTAATRASSPSEKPAPRGCTADSGGSGGREPSSRGKAISGSRGGSGVRPKSRKSTTAGLGAAHKSIFISIPSSGRAYKLSPGTSARTASGSPAAAARRRRRYTNRHTTRRRACAGSMPRAAHAARNGACASTVASTAYSSHLGGPRSSTWWRWAARRRRTAVTHVHALAHRVGADDARGARHRPVAVEHAASLSDVLPPRASRFQGAWCRPRVACCEACSSPRRERAGG